MVLVIGEILVDIFPEYRRIGGAPFNFSYHLYRFGVPVWFISRVGEDDTGQDILDFAKRHGFAANHIQRDAAHPTGKVLVHMDDKGGHEFEILPDAAYDYIELPAEPEAITGSPPAMIYFGTLVQRTRGAFRRIQDFLTHRSPNTRCLYDVNLRPGCYDTEIVRRCLAQTDVLKINDEEVIAVREMFGSRLPEGRFIEQLMADYDIEMVSLTRGKNGSELFTRRSRHETGVPDFGPVADSVGAGDAYAAVLAYGYINGWAPDRILSEAAAFSAQICRIQGAIPENRKFYESIMTRIAGDRHA